MPATDAPDLARLQARLASLAAWLAAPPAADPYADGLSGDAERAREIAARRRESIEVDARLAAGAAKRTADIRAISAESRRQGLDDDTLADMIRRITAGRTDSRGHMSQPERAQLLRELGGRKRGATRRPGSGRGISTRAMSRVEMLKVVDELLRTPRGGDPADGPALPRSYAEAILCQQRGLPRGTACPIELATDPELRGVIAALYRRAHPDAPRRTA